MKRALLALVVAGCATAAPYVRDQQPCQAQVVDLLWRQAYGRPDRPPNVWWVPLSRQDCVLDHVGTRGIATPTQSGATVCAMGVTMGPNTIDLVWYPQLGDLTWRNLAHEMWHVIQYRRGEPTDYLHRSAGFAPGGDVERAVAAMREADLCGAPRRRVPSELVRR